MKAIKNLILITVVTASCSILCGSTMYIIIYDGDIEENTMCAFYY